MMAAVESSHSDAPAFGGRCALCGGTSLHLSHLSRCEGEGEMLPRSECAVRCAKDLLAHVAFEQVLVAKYVSALLAVIAVEAIRTCEGDTGEIQGRCRGDAGEMPLKLFGPPQLPPSS